METTSQKNSDNPNDVAAQFVQDHPDWELILDDNQDVIFIASPFYQFTRTEEDASSQ